jgi:hypothetical protein
MSVLNAERTDVLRDLTGEVQNTAAALHGYAHRDTANGTRFGQWGNQLPSVQALSFLQSVIAAAVYEIASRDEEFVSSYLETLTPSHKRLVHALASKPARVLSPPRR